MVISRNYNINDIVPKNISSSITYSRKYIEERNFKYTSNLKSKYLLVLDYQRAGYINIYSKDQIFQIKKEIEFILLTTSDILIDDHTISLINEQLQWCQQNLHHIRSSSFSNIELAGRSMELFVLHIIIYNLIIYTNPPEYIKLLFYPFINYVKFSNPVVDNMFNFQCMHNIFCEYLDLIYNTTKIYDITNISLKDNALYHKFDILLHNYDPLNEITKKSLTSILRIPLKVNDSIKYKIYKQPDYYIYNF